MTRRVSFIALAALLTGVLTMSFSPASAQPTKSGIREEGKQAIERGQAKGAAKQAETKWESLSPQTKQKLQQEWKTNEEQAMQKWEAMTPQQQAQEKQRATAAGKRLQKKWQQLPQ